MTAGKLQEKDAHAPDVHGGMDASRHSRTQDGNLRRHESRGAVWVLQQRALCQCQAQIPNRDIHSPRITAPQCFAQQDVLGLQVHVHEVACVHMGQPQENLLDQQEAHL
jgi:hypothetical protein